MSTPLDELRSIMGRMRRVKTGDLILADDHNTLVDYAEKSLIVFDDHDRRIAALEQQPPYPPASGIDPWTAIANSPELQDMLTKNTVYNTVFIEPVVVTDDYPHHAYAEVARTGYGWRYGIRSARIGKSTTYLEPGDVAWVPALNPLIHAWTHAYGDVRYTLIIAMIRPRAMQPATDSYAIASMVGCLERNIRWRISVTPDGTIAVENPVTKIDDTGIEFRDWLILAMGTYPSPNGNGRVMILDRSLNVLYTRDANYYDPTCTTGAELHTAHVLDPTTRPPTALTLEIDWTIIQSWSTSIV